MCGIFGIIAAERGEIRLSHFDRDLRRLYELSRKRGRDASGLLVCNGPDLKVRVLRHEQDAKDLLRRPEFNRLVGSLFEGIDDDEGGSPLAAIAHCRLVTHGSYSVPENNQPIIHGDLVGVHNGIVVNADCLVESRAQGSGTTEFQNLSAEGWATESDSRVLYEGLSERVERLGSVAAGLIDIYAELEGHATIAFLAASEGAVYLATNSGSLYFVSDVRTRRTVFASERSFLANFLIESNLLENKSFEIQKIMPRQAVRILLNSGIPETFMLDGELETGALGLLAPAPLSQNSKIVFERQTPENLIRCSRCVLPETYPFITFDQKGVCNYCQHYEHQEFKGREALEEILEEHRSKDGSPDVLVGLSGGRDSCYGLHVLKTQFGMNPVAYTFDWGLTTDTSRRNQARICGKLGIEHIIRAPDIAKKRRFIRKNIEAWLKRPSLGMVPLFMAGDKEFYDYGRELKKELGVGLTIQCAGNRHEQRDFLIGFCGIEGKFANTTRLYAYPTPAKLRLAYFYIKEYLLNLSYINESLLDSIWSFITCFHVKDEFLYLYEYLPWEEQEVEALIKEEYDWESSASYGKNQWRMGDGQTAFTNYIWHAIAGFSEFDNFRSHQVRDGILTRDEALQLARCDNEPKYETLEYFAHLIGLNLDEVLARINSIPKMY